MEPGRRSVWRYARALTVGVEHAVSLGEGWTPLVDGRWHDPPVRYKLEFMMPTGSFKDRGMTVMVSYLKSRGITRVLEDSSGNAGASLSAYAAAAGLTCRILVPETAPYPKSAQSGGCGAEVGMIKGSRQDVAEAALRQSAEMFYASHNWQPFFVEGTKTLAYELWEQSGFRAPDNVVVPLGYGSNVLGADRGFTERARAGEIARRPRLFGVQGAHCGADQAAFRAGGGGGGGEGRGGLPPVDHVGPQRLEPERRVVRATLDGLGLARFHHLAHEHRVIASLDGVDQPALHEGGRPLEERGAGGAPAKRLAGDGLS